MFKHCTFNMDVPPAVGPQRPLEVGVPAVLDELLEVFAPRVLWAQIDGRDTIEIDHLQAGSGWGAEALWEDEQMMAGAVLTSCPPGRAPELVRELRTRLAGRSIRTIFVSATGALRHCAPGTTRAAWYGRWKIETPPALVHLVTVRLHWTDDMHAFEFDLPNGGYPLTNVRVAADGNLDEGDLPAASNSRATILPVLGHVPRCLGLAPGDFRWSVDGDFGPLHPKDEAEMRGIWVPRLNAAAGQ